MKKIFLLTLAFMFLNAQEVEVSTLSGDVDLSNYQEIEKKNTKIIVDSNLSDVDGIYNYNYSPNNKAKTTETNILLSGNFDKIHRYEPIYFDGDTIVSESEKTFDEIMDKVHAYIDNEEREIVVSVIGYTQKIKHKNQEVSLDSGYTDFFQSVAQRDNIDAEGAKDSAENTLKIIYDKIVDRNVSKELIYTESRVGKDNLSSEEFSDGRDLNNRVNIAIYVKEVIDPDTDGDGVRDSKDYCPQTPLGAHVDVHGCPLVLSLDLKFDFDKATISDEKSLYDIKQLSTFMNKYPVYHANIVGHTDSVGNAAYNKKLSIRRAEVVKKIIIKDGVNASRLSYEGRGESEPLFENINPFNRHKNRRTEVELTLPETKKVTKKLQPRARGSQE